MTKRGTWISFCIIIPQMMELWGTFLRNPYISRVSRGARMTGSHEVRGSSPLCSTTKSVEISTVSALFIFFKKINSPAKSPQNEGLCEGVWREFPTFY